MTNDLLSAPPDRRPSLAEPGDGGIRPLRLLRSIDAKTQPAVKWAVPAGLIALLSFAVGDSLGGIGRSAAARFDVFGWRFGVPGGGVKVLVLALAVVFAAAGFLATRSTARELARVSRSRVGVSAGSAVMLGCVIIGYLTVGLGALTLMRVNLGNLLVGGAVTGVVIGIAAQQTLGNFFAGLVLLFARPYVPGQRVKIRSGGMGGPFEGVIVGADLMYTTIDTDEGLIKLPNAGLLGAAIGPAPQLAAQVD